MRYLHFALFTIGLRRHGLSETSVLEALEHGCSGIVEDVLFGKTQLH